MIGVPSILKSDHYRTHKNKAVVLLSGGLDSTTLAFWLAKRGLTVECLYIDYEQGTMNGERDCASFTAKQLGSCLHILEIPRPRDSLRKIIGERNDNEELFADVISMCSIALTFAFEISANLACIGINADNIRNHPQLQRKFFHNIETLANHWFGKNLRLLTPFINQNKSTIVRLGSKLGVQFASTWSCEVNIDRQCGTCIACSIRRQVLREAGLEDLTEYKNKS